MITTYTVRGGGWYIDPEYCRSAYRYGNGPGYRDLSLGFRLVLTTWRKA